jgi:hypothetical protein
VLKPQGAFVFSIPHPILAVANMGSSTLRTSRQLSLEPDTIVVERSYFDKSPIEDRWEHTTFTEFHRPTSEIFMGLVRSGYRVDVVLEPEIAEESLLPQILIIRARKEA